MDAWFLDKRIDLVRQALGRFKEAGADEQDVAYQEAMSAGNRALAALREGNLAAAELACIYAEAALGVVNREIESKAKLDALIDALLRNAASG